MVIRSAYAPRERRGLDLQKNIKEFPSMTKQSFKKECDINHIMGKYLKTGAIDHFAKFGPSYGDIEPVTFHEAMNVIRKSEEMFEALDSSIRKRFHNNPAEFMEFVQNPDNLEEMRKLKLARPAAPDRSSGLQPAPAGSGGAPAPSLGGTGGAAPGTPGGASA